MLEKKLCDGRKGKLDAASEENRQTSADTHSSRSTRRPSMYAVDLGENIVQNGVPLQCPRVMSEKLQVCNHSLEKVTE